MMDATVLGLFALLCVASSQLMSSTRMAPTTMAPSSTTMASVPLRQGCPRKQDIHPCECIEVPARSGAPHEVETLAFCKTIRNFQVLQSAMKGMQGYVIDFMVLDTCKLPPFPNGLFFNIGIKWMEILNCTVQFTNNFFECTTNCW